MNGLADVVNLVAIALVEVLGLGGVIGGSYAAVFAALFRRGVIDRRRRDRGYRVAGGILLGLGVLALLSAVAHVAAIGVGAVAVGTWSTVLAAVVLVVTGRLIMRRFRTRVI